MLGLMVVAILALAQEQFNVGASGELASISSFPSRRAGGGHLRMFTARATTMIASKRLAADWTIMSSFTRWLSGIVSVGLNAVALV